MAAIIVHTVLADTNDNLVILDSKGRVWVGFLYKLIWTWDQVNLPEEPS